MSSPRRIKIVYLGDYVDRAPGVRDVIDVLCDDRFLPNFDRIFLKGNHEDMMLAFLRGELSAETWLSKGAAATLFSYGVDTDTGGTHLDWREALADRLPASHALFLRALKLSYRCGNYLFVHAGVRPGVAIDQQDTRDLLWIREPFLSSAIDHGVVIVHGHHMVDKVDTRPNRIGVDTGAWRSGCLTCLVLEGTTRRVIQT